MELPRIREDSTYLAKTTRRLKCSSLIREGPIKSNACIEGVQAWQRDGGASIGIRENHAAVPDCDSHEEAWRPGQSAWHDAVTSNLRQHLLRLSHRPVGRRPNRCMSCPHRISLTSSGAPVDCIWQADFLEEAKPATARRSLR